MENRIQTGSLLALAVIATAAALHWLRPVMIPFVFSVFVTFALSLVVNTLHDRLRLPRALALFATFGLAIGGLLLTVAIFSSSARQAAAYAANVDLESLSLPHPPWLSRLLDTALPEDFDLRDHVPIGAIAGKAQEGIQLTMSALANLVSQSLLVLIFVAFLLTGEAATPSDGTVFAEIERQIQRYVATKTAISALTGVLVGTVLAVLGVPFALALGFLAFVLNFVPTVGSILATFLIIPPVLLPEVSLTTAVLALLIPGLIQIGIGNVLEPKLMGDSLDLHPITILMALIFWGMLWGFMGALLATPMTAIMKIMFARLEPTKPIAELMAGRLGPRLEVTTDSTPPT